MERNFESNLVDTINAAMQACWVCGAGHSETEDDLVVHADWVDSKNPGYSVMQITVLQNSVVKFSYDDYGTEMEQ